MALVVCTDCNKKFSDAADLCPNCGRPLKQKSLLTKDVGPMTLVYGITFLGGLSCLFIPDWKWPGIIIAVISFLLILIRVRMWSGVSKN